MMERNWLKTDGSFLGKQWFGLGYGFLTAVNEQQKPLRSDSKIAPLHLWVHSYQTRLHKPLLDTVCHPQGRTHHSSSAYNLGLSPGGCRKNIYFEVADAQAQEHRACPRETLNVPPLFKE